MASEVSALLNALQDWHKAVQQLKHQGKSFEEKVQQLEQAKQSVLSYLDSATVNTEINELIQAATEDNEGLDATAVRQLLRHRPDDLLSTELQTLRPMTTSRTKLEKLTTESLKTGDREPPLDNTDQLYQLFLTLSAAIVEEYQQSIPMSRKPKKRRRRDISLGTLQTAVGIGLLAGNTQIDSAFASASYILGGNALLSAVQNLVGSLHDPTDEQ